MLTALLEWDAAALLWFQSVRCAALDAVMTFWTTLGNAGIIWIVLSVVLLLFKRTRKAGFLSLLAMLLSLIFTNGVIKHLVGRTRPWLTVPGLLPLVEEPDPNSFPSGHTAAAFAAAVTWCRTLPCRWGKGLALLGAVLMGLSRLYVGVHYPTDVLAGAVLGCLYAAVILLLAEAVRKKRQGR